MKCAVSDFDRTFSMDGAVSRENREAVRRRQQAGHWFVIATGRNEASLRKKLAEDPELGAVRLDVPGVSGGGCPCGGSGGEGSGGRTVSHRGRLFKQPAGGFSPAG